MFRSTINMLHEARNGIAIHKYIGRYYKLKFLHHRLDISSHNTNMRISKKYFFDT